MEYKKKKSTVMYEQLLIGFLFMFVVIFSDWLFRLFVGFIIYLLIKDQILNKNYSIRTDKDGFYEYRRKKEKFLAYKDIEFVTISRKHKKFIAVGNQEIIYLFKNNIENRPQLVNHIISKTKNNKGIYVDEFVPLILKRHN